MRKLFLSLMVLFTIIGSGIAGAGSFLTMNKFMEGVDYDKVDQARSMIEKIKMEGVDLASNAEYASMIKLVESVPSESVIMLTKAITIVAILLAIGLCITAFKKHSSASILAIVLAICSIGLFVITPDLQGGMTAPMPLKKLMAVATAMFVFASGSAFVASKK